MKSILFIAFFLVAFQCCQAVDFNVKLYDLCAVLGFPWGNSKTLKVGNFFLSWIWRRDCKFQPEVPNDGVTVKVADRYIFRACRQAEGPAKKGEDLGRFKPIYDEFCVKKEDDLKPIKEALVSNIKGFLKGRSLGSLL